LPLNVSQESYHKIVENYITLLIVVSYLETGDDGEVGEWEVGKWGSGGMGKWEVEHLDEISLNP
jgi:hypothetical protein